MPHAIVHYIELCGYVCLWPKLGGNMNKDKIFKLAKGFRGRAKNCIRIARERVEKALQYSYRDRRNKKRDMRSLWIQRINAGTRQHGVCIYFFSYLVLFVLLLKYAQRSGCLCNYHYHAFLFANCSLVLLGTIKIELLDMFDWFYSTHEKYLTFWCIICLMI